MKAVDNRLKSLEQRLGPDCCRMLNMVHDELVFEVREQNLAEVSREIRACMENADDYLLGRVLGGKRGPRFRVPLKVKLRVGPSWGQLENYAP